MDRITAMVYSMGDRSLLYASCCCVQSHERRRSTYAATQHSMLQTWTNVCAFQNNRTSTSAPTPASVESPSDTTAACALLHRHPAGQSGMIVQRQRTPVYGVNICCSSSA